MLPGSHTILQDFYPQQTSSIVAHHHHQTPLSLRFFSPCKKPILTLKEWIIVLANVLHTWLLRRRQLTHLTVLFTGNYYSLSRKTVNARENFWNVYCFATNQMREETAKDNRQTAAGISHDLIWNNELAFSSTRNLQFFLWISLKKLFFDHKPTPVTWFRLFRNQTTEKP